MKKILILILITLTFVPSVYGADFSVSAPQNVMEGENFDILLSVSSDGESVNTFGGEVRFNTELLTFLGYKNDDTVIKMWVESPKERGGKIILSGIVPSGVSGLYDAKNKGTNSVPLVRLMFKAKGDGNANFILNNTKVLKNDGHGTELAHIQNNALTIIERNPNGVLDGKSDFDQTPPDDLKISFIESSFFSRTPSMIMFEANDFDTGIKYYKVKTGFRDWKVTTSPYRVYRGILAKDVMVRAYDFQGNFKEANVTIPPVLELKYLTVIVFAILFLGVWLYKLLKYKI